MKVRLIAALALVLCLSSPSLAQFAEAQKGAAAGSAAAYQTAQPVPGVSSIGAPTFVQVHRPAGGLIDVGQAFSDVLQPYINAIVNALIVALAGWFFAWFRKKTGIEVDKQRRDALTTFLQNQAGSLIADGMVHVEGKKVSVNNEALAKAANEIFTRIPDAAKHFGLTPENVGQAVADRIVDAIPQIAAGAQLIATKAASDAKNPLP